MRFSCQTSFLPIEYQLITKYISIYLVFDSEIFQGQKWSGTKLNGFDAHALRFLFEEINTILNHIHIVINVHKCDYDNYAEKQYQFLHVVAMDLASI